MKYARTGLNSESSIMIIVLSQKNDIGSFLKTDNVNKKG